MSNTNREHDKQVTKKNNNTGLILFGLLFGIPLLIIIIVVWYNFYFYPGYVN